MEPFSEREIRFIDVREKHEWALKLFSIRHDERPVDWEGFEPAIAVAQTSLPNPDPGGGRPGLGFLIAHQGRTGDYLVLGWWNHENELPLKIWVRRSPVEPWRGALDGESICVWDLEVIWHERTAWIQTMLGPGQERQERAYLSQVAPRFQPGPLRRSP